MEQFKRTELLFGKEAMEKLKNSHIAVFGVGGVGGYVVEALSRSGIEHFTLIDNDKVDITNINRQIIATLDSVGKDKVDVARERIISINNKAEVEIYKCFFLPTNSSEFDFSKYDYVVDAIDTISGKIEIVTKAINNGVKVISCMGMGNKIDPSKIKITDLYKTETDPLAKVMRRELKKRGIKKLKVVYSSELPIPTSQDLVKEELLNTKKRSIPGSCSYVPSVAGLYIASEVIKDLIG